MTENYGWTYPKELRQNFLEGSEEKIPGYNIRPLCRKPNLGPPEYERGMLNRSTESFDNNKNKLP
jgi:hypothetical protein